MRLLSGYSPSTREVVILGDAEGLLDLARAFRRGGGSLRTDVGSVEGYEFALQEIRWETFREEHLLDLQVAPDDQARALVISGGAEAIDVIASNTESLVGEAIGAHDHYEYAFPGNPYRVTPSSLSLVVELSEDGEDLT